MDESQFNTRVNDAFEQVVDLDQDARMAWLEANCEEAVRERVLELLRRHDEQTEWLETPAFERLVAEPDFIDTVGMSRERLRFDPDTMLDHYRIVRYLGEGGMSVVYEAYDERLQRPVALKILLRSSGFSLSAVARFRQEAITLAQLKHPAIVPAYDVGVARGVHYLVMELIEGRTLADRFDECNRGDPGRIHSMEWLREQAELIATVADALDHAHRKDVIHRDVKPANVMLDAGGQPRLTDFGIARNRRLDRMTQTGQLAGTIAYMSPEQARAQKDGVDHRTDVYSLGATLYEALTLRQPFRGESIEDVRRKVLERQPPPIQQINPSVPKDLRTICAKSLEKDPSHRYQTASQVASDLRSWLEGRPILARPTPLSRRVRIWVRDHRGGVVTATIVALIGLIVILSAVSRQLSRRTQTQILFTTTLDNAVLTLQPLDRLRCTPAGPPLAERRGQITRWLRSGMYAFHATDGRERLEAIRYVPGPEDRFDYRDDVDRRDGAFVVHLRLPPGGVDRESMVQVPGGTLVIDPPGPETTMTVSIAPFWIDTTEVSNAEYKRFLDATGHPPPYHWRGIDGTTYEDALADRPIVGVTVDDAAAYAAWVGKRLPTEWEWEHAMRQPGDRLYPWDQPPPWLQDVEQIGRLAAAAPPTWGARLQAYARATVDVNDPREATTPLGILHANTNASEMTVSVDPDGSLVSVVRGASFRGTPSATPLDRRQTFRWGTTSTHRGFRCVSR